MASHAYQSSKVSCMKSNVFFCAGGIAAWLSMGPCSGWDNSWQLHINTAVATELMLMTTFLQNTKRRHRLYMHQCSQKLGALDAEVAEQLLGEHEQRVC